MKLVWGRVEAVEHDRTDVQRLRVLLDDGSQGSAVAYPRLTGACTAGDRVLLNTTAVELELGTGGLHFVVARAGEGVALDEPSGGHVMKARYTPLQVDVVAVESPESEHHGAMSIADGVRGLPVVCCGLHSQVPLVAAAVKAALPEAHIAYCMTDQAALPAALSELLVRARHAGLVDAVITCGQSFGGDLEAVTLHSGLIAAHAVLGADVCIVAIGPGVVGTATPFGHGGVAQAEAINAAAALDGQPIAVLRVSFADVRERHRAVSHHSISALGRLALASACVPVPRQLSDEQSECVEDALAEAGIWETHARADAEGSKPDLRGLDVRTMGRGIEQDPAFFAAAFAAGEVAARFAARRTNDERPVS